MGPDELLVVVGPTASGKTELALRIAEAAGGEIVSADSVQIVRGFDVGSGKPTAEERRRVPHHLVDAVGPLDPMDAARWAAMADAVIAEVRARGRLPVVCGGTYLWVRALLHGLAPGPEADPDLRAAHRALVAREGPAALHEALRAVDPESAARLSPNDVLRVSRSLEVHALTGERQSDLHRRHGFARKRHPARRIGVLRSPDELEARIAARVRTMFEAGLVDEVRGLLGAGLRKARAMRSVGYRQVAEALDRGAAGEPALEDAVVRATRIFVRRQRTWLRNEPVEWLAPGALPPPLAHGPGAP